MRPTLVLQIALLVAAPAQLAAARPRPIDQRPRAAAPATMARIPAGDYLPLYGLRGGARVHVSPFDLDREPVTRGEFLAFVRANPTWRRSELRPVFAEHDYLADWNADLDAGVGSELERPVTSVSWFAARAYCAAEGKRLPTVDEWEYAAAASERHRDASRDEEFVRRLLALYSARSSRSLAAVGSGNVNVYGVRDLHELAWEWTQDFNGVLVPDDSREVGSGVGSRDHRLFCASAAIGASDPSNYPAFMRYAFRAGLSGRSTIRQLGFRCASTPSA